MAQLSKVRSTKPISIGIDGMFMRNLTTAETSDLFGSIGKNATEGDPEVVIVRTFNEVLCDDTGEPFEDVGTMEKIATVLSQRDVEEILNAVARTIHPNASDLKK